MADLVLNWGLFGAYGTDFGATQTVDTGGVEVTVDFQVEDEGAQAFTFNADGYVAPGETFNPNSFLKLFGEGGEGGVDDTSTTTIDFSSSDPMFADDVQNVSFRLNDVDASGRDVDGSLPSDVHLDRVTIRAYDAAGNEVPVNFTPGSDVTLSGNLLSGGGTSWNPDDAPASTLIEIEGPVSRIEIDYENGDTGAQRVMVSDIHFSTVDNDGGRDGYVDGTGGDDLIDYDYVGDPDGDRIDHDDALLPGAVGDDDYVRAGDGNDTVYAGLGDDIVLGGAGNDNIDGGEGDDSLDGQDGNDLLDGGDGNDTLLGGDGRDTAIGGAGNDVIDTSGSRPAIDVITFPGIPVDADPEDDRDLVDGGAGDDVIATGDDRDTIDGGIGNDTIDAGIDNDIIRGGVGDDYITDPQGADYVEGGAGNDTILVGIDTFSDYVGDDPNLPIGTILSDPNTTDGMDTVYGGDGNDSIMTGDDADWISGGTGADTIHAGIDDDTVIGGTGNDSIIGGHGSDSIQGNDGDDWINAGDSSLLWGQEPDATDPVPTNGMDTVFGGAGNDTIFGQDDDDSIDGGTGNDLIDGGIDDDVLRGREGDDTIIGGEGADTVTGGYGEDLIMGGDDSDAYPDLTDDVDPDPENDRDRLDGRQGNDTIYGGDDDDTLLGGLGNDYLDGGIDEDSIRGGEGEDTIVGGLGADSIWAEEGRDTIIGSQVGDYVHGGASPAGINPADGLPYDYDVLDLSGSAPAGGHLEVEYTPGTGNEDGIVHYFDDTGAEIGTSEFYDIENVIVPCFTPGTAIATPKGERMVEDLQVGDRIITRDNGIQEIRWLGNRGLTGHELARAPHLRPILIQKGSLGDNLPEHDILVSPQHRLLLTGDKAQLYFEEREVLAAAKHLTDLPGVDEVGTLGVTYVHFMFDQHEVVLSNGIWSESFQPGASVLDGLGSEQRSEILELFPALKTREGVNGYSAARRSLKKHEAKLLVR